MRAIDRERMEGALASKTLNLNSKTYTLNHPKP